MSARLTVILDDRAAPGEAMIAAIGDVRYADVIRRRRTMAEELTEICREAGAETILRLDAPEEGTALAERIRERGNGDVYLRLPLCLPPLSAEGLAALVKKAGFALESMLASTVMGDEAVAILRPAEAATLIEARSTEARRGLLLSLRDAAATVTDHAHFVDIRQSRNLTLYLSGATETRHFNASRSEKGVFHKRSRDVAKMRAEHGFFHVAPPQIQRFLLPTFGYWEKDGEAGYAMEYLPIPDVALQWVHGAFGAADFGVLLDQLFGFLEARPAGEVPGQTAGEVARANILTKLDDRLDAFLGTETGQRVDRLIGAHGGHGDLRAMQARARPLVEAALGRRERLVFSHGDPCFSNTIFDRRIGLMRLIDPRGATEAAEALNHPLYDLAKISHSVLGQYDFINNGLFRVRHDRALALRLELTAPAAGTADWARDLFRERVAAAGFDIRAVRAVELSLFLSMLPLHADHPDKLLGFALTAGEILDEIDPGRRA